MNHDSFLKTPFSLVWYQNQSKRLIAETDLCSSGFFWSNFWSYHQSKGLIAIRSLFFWILLIKHLDLSIDSIKCGSASSVQFTDSDHMQIFFGKLILNSHLEMLFFFRPGINSFSVLKQRRYITDHLVRPITNWTTASKAADQVVHPSEDTSVFFSEFYTAVPCNFWNFFHSAIFWTNFHHNHLYSLDFISSLEILHSA